MVAKNKIAGGITTTGDWVHLGITRADSIGRVLTSPTTAGDIPLGLSVSFLKATIASNPRRLVGSINDVDKAGIALQFRAVADPHDAAARSGDILGRYIFKSTKSTNESLLVPSIRAWLELCCKHGPCSRTLSGQQVDQRNPPLPTRCVYVWTEQDRVKYRLRDTAGTRGTYITLSHRWLPDENMNSTKTTNLHSRLTGESFAPLPPLFLDCITLAARLSISYVWIDALCIVQGDGGEWAVEAERMADYYQSSLFTIACTGASRLTGLFNNAVDATPDRGPSLIRLPYRNPAGEQQGSFYLCPDQGEEETDYWENVASSELLSRGWVFQEWALSRRIVCCTASDVFFRCKEYPLRTASGIIPSRMKWEHMPDFRLRNFFAEFHELPEAGLSSAWAAFVGAYSGLKLTRPGQDRLVALSGVADEFGRALSRQAGEGGDGSNGGGGSIYIAGLWLPLLLDGLLWEKVGEEPHERLSSIPSYSWASVYARVQWSSTIYLSDGVETDCQVLDAQYAPSCEAVASLDDPSFVNGHHDYRPPPTDVAHGPVASRFPVLSLQTKLFPVFLGDHFPTQDDRDLAARLTEQKASDSGRTTNTNWRKVASHLDRKHVAGWASLEEEPEFPSDRPPSRVIFALHIARRYARSTPGLGHRMGIHSIFHVLFVRRIEGLIDGYERIGVGALFGKEIEKQFQTTVTRDIRLL